MKKILNVLLAAMCLLTFISCDSIQLNISPEEELFVYADEYGFPYIEPEKKDLPVYEDLVQVEIGMTVHDVFSIVGNPQRTETRRVPTMPGFSSTIETTCYIYDSSDGDSIAVFYHIVGDPNQEMTVYEIDIVSDEK